jgi:hypothetical protein
MEQVIAAKAIDRSGNVGIRVTGMQRKLLLTGILLPKRIAPPKGCNL